MSDKLPLVMLFIVLVGFIAAFFLLPEEPCRERVADPGRPCAWRRQPTRLEIRGGVAICTCRPE